MLWKKQIKEERERRSTVLQADGERESAIIRSKGDAAQVILYAEGEKTAKIQRAKGIAESKLLLASAEVESIKSIQESMKGSQAKSIDYMVANQYLNSLNRMTGGKTSKVFLVPSNTLDTIEEIMKTQQKLQTKLGKA